MPRGAREKSESGIYHVVLRGTNRQEIFHEDSDRIRYLETLNRYKTKQAFQVLGWCLMGNHIHLLLQEGEAEISDIMKRIGVSFVWYYNRKYNTVGHLFQDRYKSEAVDHDQYLLTVIRYIHQNPVKAKIVKRPGDWKWSSCLGYYGKDVYPPGLLDSSLILSIFSKDRKAAMERFKEFNEAENADICLDDTGKIRLTDEQAREEMKKVVFPVELARIRELPKKQRDELLLRVKKIEGITQRQAARILGVPPSLIFRAKPDNSIAGE
ncbi:MAG: transposase [Firmicutes bacterium]|nr:transposase [Bacillota bacterium]